jgi:hypothetical protein
MWVEVSKYDPRIITKGGGGMHVGGMRVVGGRAKTMEGR